MWLLSETQMLVEYLKWPMFQQKKMVLDTVLATPIKLMGALDLGIKLSAFFYSPPEVDAQMGLGMVFVNTNDCGNCTWS
jgi:hypothetical protein